MKKYLFLSLLLMLAHVQTVKAEATDVSTMDNLIYAMPFTAAQGEQVDLPFAMKNSVPIRSFQFKLYVPEGLTPVKTSGGKIKATLNASRLPEDDQHTMTFSEHEDENGNYILVLCGAEYDENFTVGDGLAFTIQFEVADDMNPGDYPVVLREMILSETNTTKYYESDNIEGTLTIEESDGRVHFKETDTRLPSYTAGGKGNVSMVRTIKANTWSTIVLPFTLTKEKAEAAFGSDVHLAEFTGFIVDYGDDEENVIPLGISISFTTYTLSTKKSMTGGKPFLIKTSQDVESFVADEVTLFDAVTDVPKSDEYGTNGKFTGSLIKTKVPADGLFISDNKFWYSTGKTNIKAFRGWFELGAVLGKGTDFSAKVSFFVDDEKTRIEGLPYNEIIEGAVYTVGGQYVGKDVDESQLPKGVYICNGKKFVVK